MAHADLSRGSNIFGNALFSHLDKSIGDGLFLSPWGVTHILAMLLEGAAPGSPSYQQISKALFSTNAAKYSLDSVRTAMRLLTDSITDSSDGEELTITDASSAWVKPQFELSPGYVEALEIFFNAQAQEMTSVLVVNSWVKEQTRGKIDSIINEQQFKMAALVLLNAIYFKGKWLEPFKKANTMRQIFRMMNGSQMDTQMMYVHSESPSETKAAKFQAPLPSSHSSKTQNAVDCVAVKMPYKGGTYSAVVAMPEGNLSTECSGGLAFENGGNYVTALSACREMVVAGLAPAGTVDGVGLPWKSVGSQGMYGIHLSLPRFEVEFEANLNDALKASGVDAMFRYGDFTKMTSAGDMEVSDVVQKVYVKVDEAGTEAAAVTAAFLGPGCCGGPPPPPELTVRFDRPFVFAIVHEASRMVLFIGEVYKTEEWKQEPGATPQFWYDLTMPIGSAPLPPVAPAQNSY